MMDGRAAPLLFATLGMLVASCATVPPPAVPVVTYAYVVVGPDGQAVARAIVAATTCPPLDVDGVAQPMTMRRKNFAPLQHQEFLFIETSIWDVDQSANSTA